MLYSRSSRCGRISSERFLERQVRSAQNLIKGITKKLNESQTNLRGVLLLNFEIVLVGKLWECCMRFGLIPIRYRSDVVL